MEVVYYQLFIAVTICLVRVFKSDWLFNICVGWTFFTIVNLFYPPLIFIQLAVVWGAYGLLKGSENTSKKIKELEKALSELTERERSNAQTVSPESRAVIKGKEHYTFLMEHIAKSTDKVVILSGWIGSHVIDNNFISLLDEKLSQGVEIYIGFGYQDSAGKHTHSYSSKRARKKLEKLEVKFPNQIYVAEFGTHEKILILDTTILVYGSANWLCNRKYSNLERSLMLTDANLAKSESLGVEETILKNIA